LKENPKDYEKFCRFKDEIQFKDNHISELRCLACDFKGHTIEKCKKIHFEIDKVLLCNKYSFSLPIANRIAHKRKNTKKSNAKLNMKYVQERWKNFLESNSQIFNEEEENYESEISNFETEENADKLDDTITNLENIGLDSNRKYSIDEKKFQTESFLSIGKPSLKTLESGKYDEENKNLYEAKINNRNIAGGTKKKSTIGSGFLTNLLQLSQTELFNMEKAKSLTREKKLYLKNMQEYFKDHKSIVDGENEEINLANINKNDARKKKLSDLNNVSFSNMENSQLLLSKSFTKKIEENNMERVMNNFEKMKNYDNYYQQDNVENIIKKFNETKFKYRKERKKKFLPRQI
jgi:hypothetical protein